MTIPAAESSTPFIEPSGPMTARLLTVGGWIANAPAFAEMLGEDVNPWSRTFLAGFEGDPRGLWPFCVVELSEDFQYALESTNHYVAGGGVVITFEDQARHGRDHNNSALEFLSRLEGLLGELVDAAADGKSVYQPDNFRLLGITLDDPREVPEGEQAWRSSWELSSSG